MQPAQPPPETVRWVSVTGFDPSLIIRLAHKYYIHPLQMEDALNPRTERLKVDRSVEGILHVLLAKITLKKGAKSSSRISREQISIFLVDSTVLYIERTNSGIGDLLARRVTYAGSKIRLNGPRFLVYSIVDAIVDQMFPIIQHFHQHLAGLQNQLHDSKETPLSCIKAIQQVYRDMNALQLYLRPLRPAVVQLVQDLPAEDPSDSDQKDQDDLQRHLLDLLDHVVVLEEQAARLANWSSSLNADYLNQQGYQMNKVMTVLTMVTTAFLPGQFLAGVFGMNFHYMPELSWRYSYAMFWLLIIILSIIVLTFYRNIRWI